jgi:cbb3-type cytochrome oxidase cytochrome c subunit
MKGFAPLILGLLATLAFSWLGLAYIPDLQIGHLEPQSDEEGTDIYPMPRSGMAERGRRVYVANGCFYCHSQQIRADYAAADVDLQRWAAPSPRPRWGDRRSAPRDYIFDRPVVIGKTRLGPDLANIGKAAPVEEEPAAAQPAPAGSPGGSPAPANASPGPGNASPPPENAPAQPGAKASTQPPAAAATSPAQPEVKPPPQPSPATATSPSQAAASSSPAASSSQSLAPYSAAWHHQHLYSPRSLNLDSNMPAYKFLYEKRPIGGQQSDDALHLRGDEAAGEGWEIVPTYDAECLVAYLMSLNQSHPLPEVKSVAAPAGSPAASPAAAQPPAKK